MSTDLDQVAGSGSLPRGGREAEGGLLRGVAVELREQRAPHRLDLVRRALVGRQRRDHGGEHAALVADAVDAGAVREVGDEQARAVEVHAEAVGRGEPGDQGREHAAAGHRVDAVVGVVGESGSGKSQVFMSVMGLRLFFSCVTFIKPT